MGKPAGQPPAVELQGLCKTFRRIEAVQDLTLTIPRGIVFGLIGPNGAGKTTAFKMLMGLLRPTAGSVSVLGYDPLADPVSVRQRVGYVPELHHIYRWMRVEQVIGFSRAFYNHWNDRKCSAMLELFGLDPRQKVKHLSKGMLGKLALLLAVSHEPELLILDEPMAGLDPLAREEVMDGVLRNIVEREQTVLFSSHTMDDVQRLVLIVGLALLIVPYLPAASLWFHSPNDVQARVMGAFGSMWGLILTIITLGLLGGNAIASERTDRSAEFQVYLPVSRLKIVVGKLLWPIMAGLVSWGVHFLILTQFRLDDYTRIDAIWLVIFMGIGFTAFFVAWLVSTLQSSPTFAVGAGMAAPLVLMLLLGLGEWSTDGALARRFSIDNLYLTLNLVVGIVAFTAGTWYYLHRVEP